MEWLLKSVIRSDVSSVEHNKDDDKIIYKESKVALEEMSQKRWKPALSWTQIYMFTVKKLPCFRAFFFFYPWATCREFMRVFFPQWCRGSAQIRGGDQHIGSYSHAFYCLHIISANNSVRVDELGFAERSGAKRGRRVHVCVSVCTCKLSNVHACVDLCDSCLCLRSSSSHFAAAYQQLRADDCVLCVNRWKRWIVVRSIHAGPQLTQG